MTSPADAAKSVHLLGEADVPPPKKSVVESTFEGREWKVTDSEGNPVDLAMVAEALKKSREEHKYDHLSDDARNFYAHIRNRLDAWTFRDLAEKYGGSEKIAAQLGDRYDNPLYDPHFPKEKTEEFAAAFFRLGTRAETFEQWLDKFNKNAIYIVADEATYVGKEEIKENLKGEAKFAPPLTYPMYQLLCEGNMSIAMLGNSMNDGNSFILTGINFYAQNGEVLANIDIYNRFQATKEVLHDLATQPNDLKKVAGRCFGGCSIV